MYVANIISQFVACHFILMTFPFSEKFLKILAKFKLSLLSFIDPAFGIISKNLSPCSMSSRFSLMLSCRLILYTSLVAQTVKASAYNVGDPGSIPG